MKNVNDFLKEAIQILRTHGQIIIQKENMPLLTLRYCYKNPHIKNIYYLNFDDVEEKNE